MVGTYLLNSIKYNIQFIAKENIKNACFPYKPVVKLTILTAIIAVKLRERRVEHVHNIIIFCLHHPETC